MNKLTRYLVLLAGVAFAMLLSVPAASALVNKPTVQGPDSHSCKDATDKVEHIKYEIFDILKNLKPEEDSQAPEVLAKLEAMSPKGPDVTKKIDVIKKLIGLKKELDRALDAKHKACQKPAEEKPTDTTAAQTFSQVHNVPAGHVDTGGGPA